MDAWAETISEAEQYISEPPATAGNAGRLAAECGHLGCNWGEWHDTYDQALDAVIAHRWERHETAQTYWDVIASECGASIPDSGGETCSDLPGHVGGL